MTISYDSIMSYAIPEATQVLSDSDCILYAGRVGCRDGCGRPTVYRPAHPGWRRSPDPTTEREFYEQIERIDAALPARLHGFFECCRRDGLEVTLSRASYILHWRRNDGRRVNFGTLFPNGDLYTNYVVESAKESGDRQIGVDYLEAVARLVPGATVK